VRYHFSHFFSVVIDARSQFDPTNSAAWIKYAELESQLADYNRARGVFELGVSQSPLSMPELLWKAYIDFEVEEGERARARALYERLAVTSGHWKVWVAYATFEAQPMQLPRDEREEDEDGDEEDEEKEPKMADGDLDLARQIFQKGYKELKSKGLKNEVNTPVPLSLPPSTSVVERENKLSHGSLMIIWLCPVARRVVTSMEVLRGAAWHDGRYCQGGRHDARAGQATLRRRGDRTTRGRYCILTHSHDARGDMRFP
jgi:tetratricopeptide (TPR) repeat protein